MKIICISNFDKEYISDILIAENVPTHYAEELLLYLNLRQGGPTSDKYFISKPDDYKLYVFNPESI